MPLALDESDGYLEVTVAVPAGAEPLTVGLDLYEANNKYAELCDRHDPAAAPGELHAAWCEWLVTKGFPPLSQGNGQRVIVAVLEAVAGFKKKAGFGSASPA